MFFDNDINVNVNIVKEDEGYVPTPSSTGIPTENMLAPRGFDEFIGQEDAKRAIRTELEIAIKYDKPFPHTLMLGYAGLGKSTLVSLIAQNLGTKTYSLTAPVKENVWFDITGQMDNDNYNGLTTPQIIYLDEIHLQEGKQEFMYTCLQDLIIYHRGEPLKVPPFTLMGATTDEGELSAPFLQRFEFQIFLHPYSIDELSIIANQSLGRLKILYNTDITIGDGVAGKMAGMSWGTPRLVNKYLKQAFKIALFKKEDVITTDIFNEVLARFCLTPEGINKKELTYLDILYRIFNGEPKGLATIASVLQENSKTVMKYIEPHLIRNELIMATPRGRQITDKGVEYIEKYEHMIGRS
mgnify:CR=1 FL=1